MDPLRSQARYPTGMWYLPLLALALFSGLAAICSDQRVHQVDQQDGSQKKSHGWLVESEDMCIEPASVATITRVLAHSARTFPLDCNVYLEWFSLYDS
jgi:hypothetical protein